MLNVQLLRCPLTIKYIKLPMHFFIQTCKNVINLIINSFACLNFNLSISVFHQLPFFVVISGILYRNLFWNLCHFNGENHGKESIYIAFCRYYIYYIKYLYFCSWSFLWRLCGVVLLYTYIYLYIYIFCVSVHFVDF